MEIVKEINELLPNGKDILRGLSKKDYKKHKGTLQRTMIEHGFSSLAMASTFLSLFGMYYIYETKINNRNDYDKIRKEAISYAGEMMSIEYSMMCQGWIYFIQNVKNNAVKIGYSKNPAKRLSSLQCGSPNKLKLLEAIPGDQQDEKDLHDLFNDDLIRGEWFNLSEKLMEFINSVEFLRTGKKVFQLCPDCGEIKPCFDTEWKYCCLSNFDFPWPAKVMFD